METNTTLNLKQLKLLRTEFTRFMMSYKFAMDEVNTKIGILKQEFNYVHEYNPIEHIKSRIKTPESILRKMYKKGHTFSLPSIRENIHDIAGIRIVCSFASDIYKISDMLQNQEDVKVIAYKDYIKNPKPNGYKSLHLVLQVPVFMSDRVEHTNVEIQIRTIAMDFWASLEHKIYYKYNKDVPQTLKDELKEAADTVSQLDKKMENIHKKIIEFKKLNNSGDSNQELFIDDEKLHIPDALLKQILVNDDNEK